MEGGFDYWSDTSDYQEQQTNVILIHLQINELIQSSLTKQEGFS